MYHSIYPKKHSRIKKSNNIKLRTYVRKYVLFSRVTRSALECSRSEYLSECFPLKFIYRSIFFLKLTPSYVLCVHGMYFMFDSTVELGKWQAYDSQRGFSISGILLVIGGIGDFFTNKINNQIKK